MGLTGIVPQPIWLRNDGKSGHMSFISALKRIFSDPTLERPFSAPPGILLFAVGDIHGQADPLRRLLAKCETYARHKPGNDVRYIFVGDYVDRGLAVRDVFEQLIAFNKTHDCVFLRGNHDQMLLDFLADPEATGPGWMDLGGRETLAGYGVKVPPGWGKRDWTQVGSAFRDAFPHEHYELIAQSRLRHEEGDFLFVHAGVNPNRPLDKQDDYDLMWIRDDFLRSSQPLPKMVVHGHTPTHGPVYTNNRIGIDTGAYLTGVLTAVAIRASEFAFLSTDPEPPAAA